jgi:hypothetical protein
MDKVGENARRAADLYCDDPLGEVCRRRAMSPVGSSAQLAAKSATSSHPCWARVKWDRPGG